jgi:ribosome biogenesis SPOUT family RNA methylase Rps3
MNYVIEHLEPELDEWSTLEYLNIAKHVDNRLWLTHLDSHLIRNLPSSIEASEIKRTESNILELCQSNAIEFDKVLLLDPASQVELSPQDASQFKFLLFGGILGDDPPRDRTKELRKFGFQSRHLGPIQMTTDTAVLVAQQVLEHQKPLESLNFVDKPEIKLGKKESVQLPFRYLVNDDGAPTLPDGLLALIRKSNELSLN